MYNDYMNDMFFYNQNYNYMNMGYNPNLNNMYPSIYRILQPVVSRVTTGNNYQFVNEESLNSMVDTVYNIVQGDNLSSNENEGINNTNQSQNSRNTSVQNNNESKGILRDLIKILLIKEISNRNNLKRMANYNMFGSSDYGAYYDQRYMF